MPHPFDEDLQSVLSRGDAYEYLPSGSWMEGGCALLALGLQRLIPASQLMMVGRLDQGIPDHVVLQVDVHGDTFYLDFDGLQTEYELLQKVAREWRFTNPSLAPADPDLMGDAGLLWLADAAPGFSDYLRRNLGPIDADRLDPAWADSDSTSLSPY